MPCRLVSILLNLSLFAILLLGFSESTTAQTFGPRQDLLLGFDGSIFDLKAVDVDLDGDLDVIRLHENWCTLYRQVGTGTNNFSSAEGLFQVQSSTSGDASNTILTGDLNGDGYPDIVVDDKYVLSNGQGDYSNVINDISIGPIRHLGDIDDDGDLDFIRTHAGFSGSFRAQYNNGNGRFQSTSQRLLQTGPLNLRAAGDFNDDGREDFVMSVGSETQLFYREAGSNAWLTLLLHPAATRCATLGDLDGDGDDDILIGFTTNQVNWIRNDGNLSFALQPIISRNLQNPISASRMGIGDLDNDGDLDLAIGEQSGQLAGYYNDGNGGFAERRALVTGPGVVEFSRNDIVDVDGDGQMDVLNSGRFPSWNSKLFRQVQVDSFEAVATFSDGLSQPRAIRGIDLDGDGEAELLERYTRWSYRSIQGSVLGTPEPLPGQEASQFVDIDNDGLPEILSFDPSNAVIVYRNLGNFQWDSGTVLNGLITAGQDIGYGDFDNDGDIDLFAANGSSTLASNAHLIYYENDGNGNFQDFELYDDVQIVLSCRAEDLDNDGLLDMVITRGGGSQRLQWYRNDGNRQFSDQGVTSTSVPSNVHMWEYHDVDNDGDFDLVYGQNRTSFQDVGYLERQANGTYIDRQIRRIDANASYGFAFFTMADFDLDGDLDCAVGSGYWTDIYYMENDGAGGFTQRGVIYNQENSYGDLNSVTHSDINGDGVEDVLAYHTLDGRPRLSWFESRPNSTFQVAYRDLEISCDDNGTPSQRDDIVIIEATVSGPGDSVRLAAQPADRFLTQNVIGASADRLRLELEPGSAGGGPLELFFSQLDNSAFPTRIEVGNPTCSSGPAEWEITNDFISCYDRGTPESNRDDKLLHSLGVRLYAPLTIEKFSVESNAGDFRHNWEIADNLMTYAFPTQNEYGSGSIYNAGDSARFLLRDMIDTSLQYSIVRETPEYCSYTSSVDYVRIACDNNGTVADSTDDRFQLEMYVNGPVTSAFEITTSPNLIFQGFHQEDLVLYGVPGSIFQDTLHVEIRQEGDVHVYNYALPLSGEGCSDQASSLSSFRQNQLDVYPNPVQDHFVIEGLPVGVDRSYEVFTLSGKRMARGELTIDGKGELSADLIPGSYVLRLTTGTIVTLIKQQ
ncbi:MAG: T9SS type A sorting domain-containing protein [Saprospiraceae bacterium]